MLGPNWLESNFAECDLGILAKLTTSHQGNKDDQQHCGLCGAKYVQQVEEGGPIPLLSIVEATPRVLCPVLDSLVEERLELSPVKECECGQTLEWVAKRGCGSLSLEKFRT